ncbi:MAG: hypothetical protein Q4B52_04010 [Tissierellia bacterium]|nr:hypothetical protein [Tissierellia bacterium]
MKKNHVSLNNVIHYAGALIALLLGSGFATGQEILQYFAAFGYKGLFGAFIFYILLSYISTAFIAAGYREDFQNSNDIFTYFCGKYIGRFLDYFCVLFNFLSFTVMISGASATGMEHYGWTNMTGAIFISVLTIVVVSLGLKNIVEIIGKIGPIIILISIFVAVVGIIMHVSNAENASEMAKVLIESGKVKTAGSNFIMAIISYIGVNILWIAPFLSSIGKTGNSLKEVKKGTLYGSFGFSVAILLMACAIFFSIDKVGTSQIPTLLLAKEIHPMLSNVFSIIILIGIFTTAVPFLYNVISRFFKEGDIQFKVVTIILGIIGLYIGIALDFNILVNYVYGLSGFIGVIMFFFVIYKNIKK